MMNCRAHYRSNLTLRSLLSRWCLEYWCSGHHRSCCSCYSVRRSDSYHTEHSDCYKCSDYLTVSCFVRTEHSGCFNLSCSDGYYGCSYNCSGYYIRFGHSDRYGRYCYCCNNYSGFRRCNIRRFYPSDGHPLHRL